MQEKQSTGTSWVPEVVAHPDDFLNEETLLTQRIDWRSFDRLGLIHKVQNVEVS